MSEMENRDYLLACAAWQETLLQAYRSLHVTIQSILLAIGIGLTVASVSVSDYPSVSLQVLICTVILTCVALLHIYSTKAFSGVVRARGEDINWWHKEIIRIEHECDPNSRFFTQFKVHQQARRNDVVHLEEAFFKSKKKLSESIIEELIGKGLGHTRIVIDKQLFVWIGRIWWLLLATTWSGPLIAIIKLYNA